MGEASQRPSDLSHVARVDEVEGLSFLKNGGVTCDRTIGHRASVNMAC
jgi:hypothetical protein